jgi:transcriptional regulator with XRE-family HTH domain
MPTVFRLRELLKKLGLSQRELGRQAGISYVTVNRLCSNTTTQVSLRTLDKIAGALGVEPGELIAREKKGKR